MPLDAETLAQRFRRLVPPGLDHASLRVVEEHSHTTRVRQDVVEPAIRSIDRGAMVTVLVGDGIGYAASSDLTDAGLHAAIERAVSWARLTRGRSVFDAAPTLPRAAGRYASATVRPLELTAAERIDLLMRESKDCRIDPRIVDWEASLWTVRSRQMTANLDGGETLQEYDFTIPALHVVAHAGAHTQTRSWGGRYNGYCQQGGLEVIERSGFVGSGRTTAEDALQLLAAPNCPSGRFDLLLMPDQMMLQIHESIGHPLELDRILGDERNYAGTSFVTLDMFGAYRYGSTLLNVLRLRRRGQPGEPRAPDPRRPAAAAARRHDLAATGRPPARRPARGGHRAQLQLEPAADRPHEQPERRAGRLDAGRDDRLDRRRHPDEDQCFVVDRRLAQQVPVRLRVGPADPRRPAGRGGPQSQLPRRLGDLLALAGDGRRCLDDGGDGHAVLRQGRAEPGDPRRPRQPGLPQAIRVGHASPACRFDGVDVFGAEE